MFDFNIILFTETWLCDDISNNEFMPSHYAVFRCDRKFEAVIPGRGDSVVATMDASILCETVDQSLLFSNRYCHN